MSLFISSIEFKCNFGFNFFKQINFKILENNAIFIKERIKSSISININTLFKNVYILIDEETISGENLHKSKNEFKFKDFKVIINIVKDTNLILDKFRNILCTKVNSKEGSKEKNVPDFILDKISYEIEKARIKMNHEYFLDKMYGNVKHMYKKRVVVKVDRKKVLEESVPLFLSSQLCIFGFKVQFKNEIGLDYLGIRREWFYLINEELVESKYLVKNFDFGSNSFVYDINRDLEHLENIKMNTNHSAIFFPYVADKNVKFSTALDDIRENCGKIEQFYVFLGIFIGLSFLYSEELKVKFSTGFYENLLDKKYKTENIADEEILEVIKNIEKENESNAKEFLEDYFNNAQYECIRFGFLHVFSQLVYDGMDSHEQLCGVFTRSDLQMLFSPVKIYKEQVKKHFVFDLGFKNLSYDVFKKEKALDISNKYPQEVFWFYQIVDDFTEEDICKLMQFTIGNLTLKEKIKIKQNSSKNSLISASTCSCLLFIGKYSSKEMFSKKIKDSIYECEGFHIR
ncbi:hypothetical protein EHP00_2712 [Ecytonucleospora hepatopenaei]|uniref:HECT-type E3 ubiquitin transferase n=1 Tax=Ecytonucleospora hepatopenaei TaxID=646526 RepID=A0A1W0E6M7_9MICR|nr:Smurf1 [Ecytonucleospora hepatopenaei]OQS54910.1 hypothetical protein EHP00_2712 [Ecytonucleospora hepatopenaei]